MKATDIAWIAGILEGEGYFGLANRATVRIVVTMTDEDVIRRVADILGAPSVRRTKEKAILKAVFSTAINGKRAIAWMMTVYGFMGVRRRARIRLILSTWITAWEKCPSGHAMTPENVYLRSKSNGSRIVTARECRTCNRERRKRYA
jgi:hypothetical protein